MLVKGCRKQLLFIAGHLMARQPLVGPSIGQGLR